MNYRVLLIIVLFYSGNLFGGEPVWQKELTSDSNLGYLPGVVAVDVKENKLIIAGASIRSGTGEGDFILLEVDPNGNILRRSQLGEIPQKSAAMPLFHRFRDIAIRRDNSITILGDFDSNTLSSLLTTDRKGDNKSVKTIVKSSLERDRTLILKMKPVSNDSLVLAGRQGQNGLLIKLDNSGNEVWKKTFDLGQTEIFTDAVVNGDEIYVVGYSGHVQGKMAFDANSVQNFLLLYDSNGQLKKEEYFVEGTPFPTETPQISRLSSGTLLVVYDKSKEIMATDLNVRAYTPDLKLLWETQVLKTEDGPPVFFKIIAVSGDKFFVGAVVNGEELVLAEYTSDGKLIERWTVEKIVGSNIGLHLAELDGKVYAVFSSRSYGNFQNIKIKVLAFAIK